jgi:hypothetical protein
MSKHTPGPWSVGDKPGVWVGPVITANSGKKGIAFVVGQTDSGWLGGYETSAGEDRTNANAHLIAAAPELLAALKAHIPWKNAGQPEKPPQGWGIWQDAVDAINKAEGRAV